MITHPRPILVLGARVVHGAAGPVLAARLDTALDIARRYPSAPIIVSGEGEAPVMADYLAAAGLPRRRIVLENQATSTNENLERALALCSHVERFEVVTSNFHALRTRLWAWHHGIGVVVHRAPTPVRKKPKNYLREIIATPHSAARVLWRKYKAR
ncbi:YdcF family protein [Corynebacterium endometrii]|uniref:DUF218 domain-containing protein n=1 Tax=Corynebacterium endometrii TaxID=2488819 RepID=A0A4P7QFV3_9CORY|nr:YdcF family protein [Corynebacterium endometrii]QCB27836.1 hypothetical protein CENDO_02690 [Corynebacterium endometrii]